MIIYRGTQLCDTIFSHDGALLGKFSYGILKAFVAQIKNPTKASCYSNFALSGQNICFSRKWLVLAAKCHRRQNHS